MSLPDNVTTHHNSANALATDADLAAAASSAGARDASATDPAASRTLGSRLLDYSAHVAMIVGLVGFAWTVSNHVVRHPTAAQIEGSAAATKPNEMTELRHANRQMAEDVRQLRASLDALRASVRADKTPAEVRILQAGLENVQSGLAAARAETATAMVQIGGKLDKIERERSTGLQHIADRVGRLEKGTVDLAATGSIPAAAVPAPTKTAAIKTAAIKTDAGGPAKPVAPIKPVASVKETSLDASRKPQESRRAADEATRPQVLSSYVVRDVYDGVALIEGRHGPMEVVPGVSVPGAGVVKSIERHGGGWTVTTTKGLLAYVAPPREYRHAGARDFDPPYHYDF